jgi:hypothetical protein
MTYWIMGVGIYVGLLLAVGGIGLDRWKYDIAWQHGMMYTIYAY